MTSRACKRTASKAGTCSRWSIRSRLVRVLETMLDEQEFLSDHGIRSLSRFHKDCPYVLEMDRTEYRVEYDPAESRTGMFGGNSNWRGPIWFPINYLLIEALQKFDFYYGEEFVVEFPTGSGKHMTLWEVSQELEKRLCSIFLRDGSGKAGGIRRCGEITVGRTLAR